MFEYFGRQAALEAVCQNQNDTALVEFAESCWRSGHYDDAITAYQRLAKRIPSSVQPLLSLCKAVGNFRYDEAQLNALLDSLSNDLDSAAAVTYLCRASIGKWPIERILTLCEIWIGRFPSYRPLLVLYQALLVLLNQASPRELLQTSVEAHEYAELQSLLVCNQAKNSARIVGLPVELMKFAISVAPSEGCFVECGVYFGRSARILAESPTRKVFGFDSFQGLPEEWKPGEGIGSYSTSGLLPPVPENVELIAGWFKDTLPAFVHAHSDLSISLLHIDCDLYSSTYEALSILSPMLRPGSIIIFDDMLGYPGWEQHEWRAFQEFSVASGRSFRFIGFVFMGREVAVQVVK